MKKIIPGLMALGMVTAIVPQTSFVQDFSVSAAEEYSEVTIDNMTFYVYKNYAELHECDYLTKGEVVVPSKVNGVPVTSLGEEAFSFSEEITSITVPDSVRNISKWAFFGCISLTSIKLPESVDYFGDVVFKNCKKLTSVKLPVGIENISPHLFYDCRELTEVTIPDGVKSIGQSAFYFCEKLESITLPESVRNIEKLAFDNCQSLKEIVIPKRVGSIGFATLGNCKSLEKVTFLNPECEFYDSDATIYNTVRYDMEAKKSVYSFKGTIYGYDDSTAQKFAEKYGYNFESLGEAPEMPTVNEISVGDVNMDGNIDAVDASNVLTAYSLTATGKDAGLNVVQQIVADVNFDGNIDAIDASLILGYYAYKATGGDKSITDFLKK